MLKSDDPTGNTFLGIGYALDRTSLQIILSFNERDFFMLINKVKELRTSLNLTQSELGQRVGVTRQTISFIEKGIYDPSVTLAIRISEALGYQIGDVFWINNESVEK
ncbi:helix-turn-helix transcriptional regulator [Sporosarcina soli]|uniref:Helix-turn-helix transcriptional regulator n=1 Tax=Sporosarcina soli TaxID=334736 RepID=A0ABW0TKX5_9BACL